MVFLMNPDQMCVPNLCESELGFLCFAFANTRMNPGSASGSGTLASLSVGSQMHSGKKRL